MRPMPNPVAFPANWGRVCQLQCKVFTALVFGFLMVLTATRVHASEPDRIMLLASYHAGLAWTDDQVAAVKSQLQPRGATVDLQIDFLDTKHIRPTPAYYQRLEALLLTKYGATPPKAILAIDDDALDFALSFRQHQYPEVPILFSGIAASRQAELAKIDRLAGVFDDVDIAQTLTTMLALLPATRRLVVIHDQSRTALAQVDSVRQMVSSYPSLAVEYLTDMDVEAIQARLRALGATDLVFQLTFNRDTKTRVLSHEEASDLWSAASAAPVAVTRDVSMRPGTLGGLLITGYQQGETLGKFAVRVLQNEPSSHIGMVAGTAVPTFDYVQMQRWQVSPARLPKHAVVLNQPISSWLALRPHLPWLGAVFGGLLVIIGLLLYVIRVRRRSEVALRRSTQNYMELFNSSTDAILVRDTATGRIVQTNARFHNLYGFTSSELATLTVADMSQGASPYGTTDAARWMEKAILEGPQLFEWWARRKDGNLFWAEISLTRFQSPDGQRIVSTVRDITDRKLVETQACEFAFHINQIYENLPVAVFALDATHKLTFWNAQMALMSGIPASEVVGTTDTWRGFYANPRPCLADLVLDGLPARELQLLYADKLQVSTMVTNAIEGEDYFPTMNHGQGMWLRFCAAPLHNAQGELTGSIETLVDVTALKQSQQALEDINLQLENRVKARTEELELRNNDLTRALVQVETAKQGLATSEFRLANVLAATGDGIWDMNLVTGKAYTSARWCEMLGYDTHENEHENTLFTTLLLDEEREGVLNVIRESLDGQKSFHLEHRMRRRDGSVFWVADRGNVVERDTQGKPLRVVGSISDINDKKLAELALLEAKSAAEKAHRELELALTDLKQTQSELLQKEKMAALGALVAGVSHELNTPLGNAVTVASTLQDEQKQFAKKLATGLTRSELSTFVQMVKEAGEMLERNLSRASDLIQSFKQVAVDQSTFNRRTFDLKDVVHEIMLTMSPSIKRTPFVVVEEVAPDLRLDSFPGPLGQVLMNLVNNSLVHGLDGRESGTITIKAQAEQAGWVVLSVADDGCGIPADRQQRIFDPFFTTRLGKGGSGLGLHIVFNIITGLLGGTIDVASAQDRGSEFRLRLPLQAPLKNDELVKKETPA